jgi:hypothetical protein
LQLMKQSGIKKSYVQYKTLNGFLGSKKAWGYKTTLLEYGIKVQMAMKIFENFKALDGT